MTAPPLLNYYSPGTPDARLRRLPILYIVPLTLAGLVLPVPAVALGFIGQPMGQSGPWHHFPALVFVPKVGWPLYPLVMFAMMCFALVLFVPGRFARVPWVRLGVYLAVVVNLVYVAAAAGALEAYVHPIPVVPAFPPDPASYDTVVWPFVAKLFLVTTLAPLAALVALEQARRRTVLALLWVGGALAVLGVAVAHARAMALMSFDLPISRAWYLLPAVAAFWPLTANLALAAWTFRQRWGGIPGFVPGRGPQALVGAGAAGSFALTLASAIYAYNNLPAYSSLIHCYVASAAARGHRRFVGSRLCRTTSGPFPVNDQLRWLIVAEIALRLRYPRAHRLFRAVYDALGPRLACGLVHPLAADVAYVSLKPAEWAARAWLGVTVRDAGGHVHEVCPVVVAVPTIAGRPATMS